MFLRVSTVNRNNRKYCYAQIVQSYRRDEDGLPAHRVVANLGQLSDLEIANIRSAFNASRDNKKVIVAKLPSNPTKLAKPSNNLVYLDLAVLLEIWHQAGIDSILKEALPRSAAHIPVRLIIAILCLHRSQDPGSKLSATRWYSTTALPELTGVPASSFNNTRIHRALYDLEQSGERLMTRLPRLYDDLKSDSSAMFLDISDACFVGDGPELAEKGLSKDGIVKTKIGILLLCNREGLPLRWEVIAGASAESGAMIDLLGDIKDLPWIKGVPLVCDRAMGKTSLFQKMQEMHVLFLTALTRHEYLSYAGELIKASVSFPVNDLSRDQIIEKARALIAGNKSFSMEAENLFTIDLGLTEVSVLGDNSDLMAHKKYHGNRIQTAMYLGREIKKLTDSGRFGSIMSAGAHLKLKPGLAAKYHNLTRLPEQVQQAILDGEANNCSITRIDEITLKEKPEDMFSRFYEHVEASNRAPKKTKRIYNQIHEGKRKETETSFKATTFPVRVVAYFNPEMYADQVLKAERWRDKLKVFEQDINRRLSFASNRRTKDSVYAEIDRFVRKKDLLRCIDIQIDERPGKNVNFFRVNLAINEEEWFKRHQFDGFCILIANAICALPAGDLCRLYRSKDIVEKDFQVIKSVLQVGPVRHRTDLKVKAHVSICMISLLLERLLEKKLGRTYSARRAMEILHTCHLNKFESEGESLYAITELNRDQHAILKQTQMTKLSDDDYLLGRISKKEML